MIFQIPPEKFLNCLLMRGLYTVFFEDTDNEDYLPIFKALCEHPWIYRYHLCVNIRWNCEDHKRYFPHITESRNVLYMRNNITFGRCYLTDISQVKTIFEFYEANSMEGNFLII